MQAAILAGGLGTRLRPLTNRIPKAMAPVNGRPFLEYELELLASHGVDDIVLCVGYLGEGIRAHFGDGARFGVRIRYSSEGERLLGPVGALKMAERMLRQTFFVTYGDAYLRLDYRAMMDALLAQEELALMAVYRNEGRFGRSDVVVKDGFVDVYDKEKSAPGMGWINFGVTAMKKQALGAADAGRVCDEPTFYGKLIGARQLRAYEVNERFYEVGSEASLREFSGLIAASTRGAGVAPTSEGTGSPEACSSLGGAPKRSAKSSPGQSCPQDQSTPSQRPDSPLAWHHESVRHHWTKIIFLSIKGCSHWTSIWPYHGIEEPRLRRGRSSGTYSWKTGVSCRRS
ncbi:MAG: nucleotidyltransferase family protein [Nitrososphaerota archaeon]|nr:nucleotidyltransferase family protein [Nitrososphaerota archaeon]